MNSALQCLFHTEFLKDLFLNKDLSNEINYNNPLGTKGELLLQAQKLFKEYWYTRFSKVTPNMFKYILTKYLPTFEGYAQHDSQEFLSQLLD